MATRLSGKRPLIGGGLVLSLVVAGQVALGISSAAAATSFAVTTTADIAANAGACGNATILTAANPGNLSLREATCLANNNGGASTITIPAGTYDLANGELQVGTHSGQNVTLDGAGAGSTTIDAGGNSRVLDFDPTLLGGVTGTVSGLTITGGSDGGFGGAGIIAGSANASTADTLAISDSVITGNHADVSNPTLTNLPGGGIQFIGGSLTITDTTISNNTSGSSPGSGAVYDATGASAGEHLAVDGSTFSGNSAVNTSGTSATNGGALDLRGPAATPFVITNSQFLNNTVVATSGGATGAGIRSESGALTVTGSTFTGNSVTGGTAPAGGAIEVTTGTAVLNDNRIVGNVASSGSGIHVGSGAGAIDATENWFGCDGGPGALGCDTVAGGATTSPWLLFTGVANPATLNGPNATSAVTGSFLTDSAENPVSPAALGAFSGLPVSFGDPQPAPATLSAPTATIASGQAGVTYDSQTAVGSGHVQITVDNATVTVPITVDQAPAIVTDPSDQLDHVGDTATFVAAASGFPTPTVQWQRSTDGGATFSDLVGATSPTLSFTVASSDDGDQYRAVFTNVTDISRSATTTAATLTVVKVPPTITSADHTTFTVGTAGSFTITTTAGNPATTTLSRIGALPAGVTFTDNGDGTATLAGTPAVGKGGVYPLTITASNGVAPDATQTFTLTVNESPVITSADNATFTVGTAGSFTVLTTPGDPSTTAITETGALPSGVTFVDNGDGTATLAGPPAAATNGSYPITITASNGVPPDSIQSFTLTVSKQSQTITITSTPPSPALVGGSYPLSATATSNLGVTFSVDPATTNAACSLNVSTVSFDHAGSCVIDADQVGDGTFAAAPQVQQTISVGTVATAVSVATSPTASVFGQPVTATATVSATVGTPAGAVQFAVDGTDLGAPVTVAGGTATSVDLTDSIGNPLAPGAHAISAAFTPDDTVTYAGSQGSVSHVVSQAGTTTAVVVNAGSLVATVAPVAPGAGTPTGSVSFSVDGSNVGSAPLSGGVATLSHVTPPGMTRHVAATYSGDTDFTGSSASTARHDPRITAKVTSAHAKTHFGWYRSAVTVTFHCVINGAPLTAQCPSAVVLTHNGAGQSVTRTITATDGGADTVAVRGINIDKTPPKVHVKGVSDGAVYFGTAPKARCVATDALSGVASCVLTKHTHGTRTTYRATATDRAGNTATVTGSYRTRGTTLQGVPFRNGSFVIKTGHTYTLVVHAKHQPIYYDAAPYPTTPFHRDRGMIAAGKNRWVLGLTFDTALHSHRLWNIGYKVAGKMHVIRIRVT